MGSPEVSNIKKKIAGAGNGNPSQYSCLENSMDGGAWWASVQGNTMSQTRLSTHARTHTHTHKSSTYYSPDEGLRA